VTVAEIPLTLATTTTKCRNVIITLVGGGAHLDFRSRSGITAMHRAAVSGNCDALKVSHKLNLYKKINGSDNYLTFNSFILFLVWIV